MQPYAEERPALSEGRKGAIVLNHCDLILHLVEQLVAEKEKNFILQQTQQQQQMQNK